MRVAFRLAVVGAIVAAGLVPAVAAGAAPGLRDDLGPAAHGRLMASGGAQLWAQAIAVKNGNAEGTATAVSPDGKAVFVTGDGPTVDPATGEIVGPGITAAYNAATGAKLWQVIYRPSAENNTEFSSIAVSPDGSTVFVDGESGYMGYKLLTVAYNASTGAMLWQATGAEAGGLVWPLAVSPDGSTVFATGPHQTIAYNAATGALRWKNTVTGAAIAVSADSKTVFVTGWPLQIHAPAMTEAFNAATGARLWQAKYADRPGNPAQTTSIGLSPDGSTVFVAGEAGDPNAPVEHPRLFTVAYNAATGVQKWADDSKPMPQGSSVHALAIDPSGSALFVAEVIAALNEYQVTTAVNPATGATLWQQAVHATSGTRTWTAAIPYALAASPDGATVYVTGYETMKPPHGLRPLLAYVTIAYDTTTGHTRWTAVYQHRFQDIPNAIAVSPDGSQVFVTGLAARSYYQERTGTHMVTIAYSS
jgi:outer membrane protein assembly factor BamB